MKARITTLDTMKGLAMVLVILDHCGYALHPLLDHIEVPVFFLISGFLFSAGADFLSFAVRKAYTLIVPYVVFSLLYLVPYMVEMPDTGWGEHLFNLLVKPANYPLWFIKALFWALIGYYWLWRVISRCSLWVENAVNLLIAFAVCVMLQFVTFENMHLVRSTGLVQGLEALPLIGFGHTASRLYSTYKPKEHRAMYAFAIFVGAIVAMITGIEPVTVNTTHLGNNVWLYYPSVVSCGIVFAAACRCISWLTPINYVGRNSVTFFGFHAIAIFILAELAILPQPLLPVAVLLLCVPAAELWRKVFRK